jgi:hypothetical protein
MTDEQLAALTNDLENVQALPASEPEAVTIATDNEGME